MPVTETEIIEALRPVEDPELHRSIVDLDMVRDVAIDGRHGRACRSRSPSPAARCATRSRTGSPPPSTALDGVDARRPRLHGDDRRGARRAARAAPRRPGAPPPAPTRATATPRAGPSRSPIPRRSTRVPAHRLGQGRRRQVVGHHQPAVALAQRGHSVGVVDADVWGFSIPRMLGVDRPPGGHRRDAHAARGATACAASRWASSPRRTSRSSGGARCCTRRSSSSSPTSTGTSPTSCSSTCRPAPATSPCRWRSSCPAARSTSSPRPQPAAQRVAQRAAFMAQKVNLEVKGVIENMSWFTGDDGKRYELFGAGGGQELADRARGAAARPGAAGAGAARGRRRRPPDRGRSTPTARPPQAFAAIAERIDVELAPTRVFNPELKLI